MCIPEEKVFNLIFYLGHIGNILYYKYGSLDFASFLLIITAFHTEKRTIKF